MVAKADPFRWYGVPACTVAVEARRHGFFGSGAGYAGLDL